MLKFLLGMMLGGSLGVVFMCLFQVAGSDREEFEKNTERE